MKNSICKKALSLVLAAVLVVGMLPQMSVFAAEPTVVSFDFKPQMINRCETGIDEKTSLNPREITNYFEKGESASYPDYFRKWKYFTEVGNGYAEMSRVYGTYIDGGSMGNWVAYKVKGIGKGTYNVSIERYSAQPKGCVYGVYVFDSAKFTDAASITTALNAGTAEGMQKVGEADVYATTASSIAFGTALLDGNADKEYIVVIRAERKGTVDEGETTPSQTSYCFIAFTSLKFELIEVLDSISAKNISAVTGRQVEPALSWISTSGTECADEKIIDSIELVENDGALVQAKDGSLYAMKPGTASVKVTGHLKSGRGGKKTSNVAVITVTESNAVKTGEKITFAFLAKPIFTNEQAGVDFEYETTGKTVQARSVTDYFSGTGSYSRNWNYFTETVNAASAVISDNNGMYFDGDKKFGNWLAFKIKGVLPGTYNVSMEKPVENRKGCVWGLYVLDADKYADAEAITSALSEPSSEGVVKVGEVDTYGSAAASLDFGKVTLSGTADSEYILVFRSEREGIVDEGEDAPLNSAGTIVMSSTQFIAIKGLTFDGTYIESVDTVLSYSEIGIGESTAVIATTGKKNTGEIFSDMSELAFVNYEIIEGKDVVKLESDGKTLKAIGNGTAVLETSVIHDGRVIIDRDGITVADDYGISELCVSGSRVAYTGNHFRLAPLAVLGNGTEIIPDSADVSFEILSGDEFVTAEADTLIAGNEEGTAKVRIKAGFRGKTYESESFDVSVVDSLEPLSGKTYTYSADGISFDGKVGEYATAKIDIPATGRYQATLSANLGKTSGKVVFYAIPYNDAVNANPLGFIYGAYKLFEADLYSRSFLTTDIPLDDAVFDAPGEYLLVMQITGKNDASIGYDISLNSITFDGESFISEVKVDVDETKLGFGETTSFEVFAYLSNGTEIPIENATIEYVANERLFTVDAEKMTVTTSNAVIEPAKNEMTVRVTYKDYTAEKSIAITVDPQYGVNPEKKALLYGNTEFSVNNKISFTPAVELSNRNIVQVSEENAEYVIVENSDGAVAFDTDGTTLQAVTTGKAIVKANVYCRGNVYESEEVLISVVENTSVKNLEINFTKGGHAGDGFETLDSATAYTINRSWVFHEIVGNDKTQALKMEPAQAQLNFNPLEDDKYLALKVKLSGSGKYNLTAFSNKCRSRAGQFDMYIFPATKENATKIPAMLTTENYVGYMDFYNETTASNGVPGEIIDVKKDFEISNGEYFVILELVPRAGSVIKDSRGDVVYPTYIRFADIKEMNAAELVATNAEIDAGTTTELSVKMLNCNGEELNAAPSGVIYRSLDTSIATVSENGVVTGIAEGKAEIRANVSYGDTIKTASTEVYVKDTSPLLGISLSVPQSLYIYGSKQIYAVADMESGKAITIPEDYITWAVSDDNIAEIENGRITGKNAGMVTVTAQISEDYKSEASAVNIAPVTLEVTWDSKAMPTLFTVQQRENAKKNAEKYSWARDMVKSATKKADEYLESFDVLYDMIVPENLPRYYHVGTKYDDAKYRCRYCDYDIGANVNIYGWTVNPLVRQWKIQCPDCKRVFPSNDFGSFYKLGVTESGSWSYEQALQRHHELFVCEDEENGNECTHTPPAKSAPEAGSEQWMKNDPRNAAWYAYYGYGVEGGYLNNDLYEEMDEKLGVRGWGVDDGFGYRQPYVSDPSLPGYHVNYNDDDGDGYARFVSGSKEGPVQHTYIAYYLHEGVWLGAGGLPQSSAIIKNAMTALKNAFLYTGDAKYGRAGAILLDRIADMFPDYDWYRWKYFRGDNVRGTVVDAVWSTNLTISFVECCDAFLPMYNDQYVIDYLSGDRARYEVDEETGNWKRDENGDLIPVNLKDSPGAIRKNAEEGILLASYKATREGKLYANFGPEQETVGKAAIVINRMPETKEMLDWVFNYGEPYNEGDYKGDVTGGDVLNKIIDDVDRDGNGGENAPQYNLVWMRNLANLADSLSGYELYPMADLFANPKYVKMLTGQIRQTLGGYYTPQTGDSGYTASKGMYVNLSAMLTAFKHTKDRLLARAIWKYNEETLGGDISNLHGSLFDEDAEAIMRKIEAIVKEDGEFALGSELMAGYGLAALRAGGKFNSAASSTEKNTHRDFAMYFGATDFHGHSDSLNLYISAFGLNFAPDLGYPASTGVQPNRFQWVRTTLSHNTVVVDETEQMTKGETAIPHHFDDAGRVRLFDASADVYAQTDEYRRSLIMVDVNDDISYGVDFFHVYGGSDHLYSFHSQSDEICATEGLGEIEEYPTRKLADGTLVGTYAGTDVPYGGDPGGNAPNNVYPLGYTWLRDVRTSTSPQKDFSVEFKLKDWNKALSKTADLRLRMTMVSDEPMDEVTFAKAQAPQRGENKNIGDLEYVLVRNKGRNLDTTFTTVFEPYEAGNKYLKSVKKLPMIREEGSRPGLYDSFAAVRVEHMSGRVDYVIYSTNTDVEYTVTDDCGTTDTSDDVKIAFCGFAGVMTIERADDGTPSVAYRYLNDGKMLRLSEQEELHIPAYTGKVKDFTTDLTDENFITVAFDEGNNPELSALEGKYIYIENDGVGNGVYKIEKAQADGDNVKLSLGNVTLIRRYLEPTDIAAGYVYNIAAGQKFRIPVSSVADNSPVVQPIDDVSVSAGNSVIIPYSAVSPVDKALSVLGTGLPRGMSVDEKGNKLIWKPDSSQVGENHVALTVSDGTLETTVHFTVTVYGSTTGGKNETSQDGAGTGVPDRPSDGSAINGGESTTAGVGGGAGGTAQTDEKDNVDGTNQPDAGNIVNAVPQFTDLTNHAWATDAITALSADGIIRGTSETTFSPAANITRADFALLLVRAFKLTSDNTKNFADVSASDYFADELAIARNTGIVGGIGDNRYAPRSSITRQDMMVIVYRALQKLNARFGGSDEPQHSDFTTVAEYARDAVTALIGAGLVNGKNGRIEPNDYTTRAEVAVLIKRILDYIK